MPVSNTTNPKGKAKAKLKVKDSRHLDATDSPNDETNASSSGLPLADDQSSDGGYEYNYDIQTQRLRIPLGRAWRSYLLTALLAFLTVLLGLGLLVIIVADSYAAPAIRRLNLLLEGSESARNEFISNALLLGEPEGIWVDSIERGDTRSEPGKNGLEINATVAIRIGVDTDYVMGLQNAECEDNWLRRAWAKTVRWGVSRLETVTAHVDQLDILPYNSQHYGNNSFINFRPLSPIPVSLCAGLRISDDSPHPPPFDPLVNASCCNLPLLRLSFSIYPSDNATALLEFLEQSWNEKSVRVTANVLGLTVVGGTLDLNDPASHPIFGGKPKLWQFSKWRRWVQVSRPKIETDIELEECLMKDDNIFPVPPVKFPNMPPLEPGSSLPEIADLLVLESFDIITSTSVGHEVPNALLSLSDSFVKHKPNGLQHVLFVEDPNAFLSVNHLHDSKFVSADKRNIVLLAHASLIHPFGTLASLIDLGARVPPLPFIVSLPIPSHENGKESLSFPNWRSTATSSRLSPSIPVVKVFTSPSLNETHIRLPLWGYVFPLQNPIFDKENLASFKSDSILTSTTISSDFTRAISTFIRSYLSYEPSPIYLTTPFYPNLEVSAAFPPPEQKLDIIRDVRLKGMWIKPGIFSATTSSNEVEVNTMDTYTKNEEINMDDNGRDLNNLSSLALEILASATVHARVVLPEGFDVDLEVTRLWVDALIFDGEVPVEGISKQCESDDEDDSGNCQTALNTDDPTLPTPLPLPRPLPPRAFARITPRKWLNATSSLTQPDDEADKEAKVFIETEDDNGDGRDGKSIYVAAEAIDVPLQVLPGRQGDLRRFVTKVVFSTEPVVAGIKGVVAVAVKIPGLTVQTGLESAGDRPHHDSGRLPSSLSSPNLIYSYSGRGLEADPRIEGSELILTDLPFQGHVPIGKSSIMKKEWM